MERDESVHGVYQSMACLSMRGTLGLVWLDSRRKKNSATRLPSKRQSNGAKTCLVHSAAVWCS